ncbi:MAG: hotdog domain-containing protein [Planctomycetota bacterium]|nr:hotdog domain-containing protein [Planctomycetota bacterium]
MKSVPRIGSVGAEKVIVREQHLTDLAQDGMPRILCTPCLIWFLEHAARNAVLPLLEQGESTVGVTVNVDHTAATPIGNEVTCRARVIYVDGSLISFPLEAYGEHESVARGTHKLRVIEAARLARRVNRKMQQ